MFLFNCIVFSFHKCMNMKVYMKERILVGDGGVTPVFRNGEVSCGGNFHLLLSWSVFKIILICVYIIFFFV